MSAEYQQECFATYPIWETYYREQLDALLAFSPTSESGNPFEMVGKRIIEYLEHLDESESAYEGELRLVLPTLKQELEQYALLDPSIYLVIQDVLQYHGLLTDTVIKSFTIEHLIERMSFGLPDADWLRADLFAQLEQEGASEQDIALIKQLADNSDELLGKRKIDIAQERTMQGDLGAPIISPLTWQHFLQTPVGLRLATFSTVEWFLRDRNPKSHVQEIKNLITVALMHYDEDADYVAFMEKPFDVIYEAVSLL